MERYSDVRPYGERRYWYFTTHGTGPGTIPKDLHVLETREGQNEKELGVYLSYWTEFLIRMNCMSLI